MSDRSLLNNNPLPVRQDQQVDGDPILSRRERAFRLGGADQVEREHARGRLTVRERIERLLDPGSFREIGTLATLPIVDVYGNTTDTVASPYVGGFGTIGGRPVVVGGEDFTINFGAPAQHLEKFKGGFSGLIEELAFEYRLPLVLLLHGAGGDVSFMDAVGYAAVPSLHDVFPMAQLLDVVPVVTAVMGVVGGGAGARAVASHFSLMSRPQGAMFAAGPPIVERALGQAIDKFDLGGVDVHVGACGNVDDAADSEDEIFDLIRLFLAYLPTNVDHFPPLDETRDADPAPGVLDRIDEQHPGIGGLDPAEIVRSVVDAGSYFPIGSGYGRSLITGLGRVAGRTVGFLAHDARVNDGAMDGLAADKQCRFVQMCDTFHIPIVFLVDTPGVVSSLETESDGLLRRVFRAIEAMHRTTVPVVALHVGCCDGLAGMATAPANRTVLRVAWPTASFGNGEEVTGGSAAAVDPWATAEHLGVEEVIRPTETRAFLVDWLRYTAASHHSGLKTGPEYRP